MSFSPKAFAGELLSDRATLDAMGLRGAGLDQAIAACTRTVRRRPNSNGPKGWLIALRFLRRYAARQLRKAA